MKKLISVLILSLSAQVFATDWSVVKGGAQGYLDSVDGVGLHGAVSAFWYSAAGDSTTTYTEVFCSITNFDDPFKVIASGLVSGTSMVSLSVSSAGLYLASCVKKNGASGSILIGVFKEEFFK